MYELLRRAPEVDSPPNLFKMLQAIVEHCGSCQTIRSKEIIFSSQLNGEAIVCRHIELDLFYLDSKPVLHVTDKGTIWSSAFRGLLDKESNNSTNMGSVLQLLGSGVYWNAGYFDNGSWHIVYRARL
jgi:hypothetical protein